MISGKPLPGTSISLVQSSAAVMPRGLGAKRAASSTFPVPILSKLAFSQVQPPCIELETIPLGKETIGRGSRAPRMMVCVPPPLPPVTPMRLGSTSGREARKSSARIEFQACRPKIDCRRSSA